MKQYRKPLNIVIAVIVPCAWVYMMCRGSGSLAATGLRSLKYFTVLSNLLEGLASVLFLCSVPHSPLLKYIAGIAVTLTFMTVLYFLGPVFGYAFMFRGANFWFHLVVPLLAIGEMLVMDDVRHSRKDSLMTVLPLFIYGAFYMGNILLNGVGAWPQSNDWYGFARWGIPQGIALFALFCLLTYLGARLITRAAALFRRS